MRAAGVPPGGSEPSSISAARDKDSLGLALYARAEAPPSVLDRSTAARLAWALGFGLLLSGWLLLHQAERYGAPSWLATIFLVVASGAGCAHYLEMRRLPTPQAPWWQSPDVAYAFERLGNGDLGAAPGTVDALPSELHADFADALEALSAHSRAMQDSTVKIPAAIAEADATFVDLSACASQQGASVAEITAAMEQVTHASAQIALGALAQIDLAARVERAGQEGARGMELGLAGLVQMKDRISVMSTHADTLAARSKDIVRILAWIAEIATETHVLSLNAAIEATAAGDRGHRFAAVADEVRRLAKETRESIDSVRGLLEELVGAIRAIVVAIEEVCKELTSVIARAQVGAAAIADLRGVIDGMSRVAREISGITRQQIASSDEVLSTIRELGRSVQEGSRDIGELKEMVRRMYRLGIRAHVLTQTFELDSPASLKHLATDWSRRLADAPATAIPAVIEQLMRETPPALCSMFADPKGNGLAVWRRSGGELVRDEPVESFNGGGECLRRAIREGRAVVIESDRVQLVRDISVIAAAPCWDGDGRLAGAIALELSVSEWPERGAAMQACHGPVSGSE